MAYTYTRNDIFYDVESLENVFTVAWWFPHPDMNAIILSYLEDSHLIKSEADLDTIRTHIYALHPSLKASGTRILFENIGNTGCVSEYGAGVLGLQSFAKRMGLANEKTALNCSVKDRGDKAGGLQFDPLYYPVKQTDPDYDADQHGFRFGYNSYNYDTTIIAQLLTILEDVFYTKDYIHRPVLFEGKPFTAYQMRRFNDELFEKETRKNMPQHLARDMSNPNGRGDFRSPGWVLRKAWLTSGRHIDVAKLNEKMFKVGLKRLLGMLGHQIMESDKLDGNTRINTLEELADLLAYNISDVVNLQKLFEHKVYQNAFNVRKSLLETYPQTVYGQVRNWNGPPTQEAPCDVGNYTNIRRDRLTQDSTSAKFVELALAPYKPIKDIPVVSFLYPSKLEAEKLGIERTDVLEDTKRFFETYVTRNTDDQAHKDFMEIYHFYDAIRGKNFNKSDAYKGFYQPMDGEWALDHDGNPVIWQEPVVDGYVKDHLMKRYNTNLFYHHKKDDGTVYRSTCLANFSIGGIHGAEVNMEKYLKDQTDYHRERSVQEYVESLYADATEALNGPTYITLPDYFEIPKRLQNKFKADGTIKIREFVKSGSTKRSADWRVVKEIPLFKKSSSSGSWTVNKRYAYVSSGPSHHEDFASYYPLLLSRLSAFINPGYHGYDEQGRPNDPYYGMFLTRIAKKKESKDMTKTALERELAFIEQDSRKLLINAASGAGDATFDNNIRVNNAIISMRIIGQLFAWRIGQAQTLAGARVPSTNTDGLYTMDISAELNDKILEDIASEMYIDIEPERLDRFVSKDSNNRLEVAGGHIESAKGGTLNSWGGPQPTQNLSHASLIDHLLAKYLASEKFDNPANVPFDKAFARELLTDFLREHDADGKRTKALLHFQWIVASSNGSNRYYYARKTDKLTGDVEVKNLQHFNRIFLLKDDARVRQELFIAGPQKINELTWKKRQAEYKNGTRYRNDIWEHEPEALQILLENDFDLRAENQNQSSDYYRSQAKTMKVNTMPRDQHIGVFNQSVVDLDEKTAATMLHMLDLDAYLEILEETFESWSNIDMKEYEAEQEAVGA